MLELVHARPDWMGALGRRADPSRRASPSGAAARIRGTTTAPSARAGSPTTSRGCARRSTSPSPTACAGLGDTAAVAAWEPTSEAQARLDRLRERRVLDAAGFLLHD